MIVLGIGASAASYTVTTMHGDCLVDSDGTCHFTVSATLRFQEPVTEFSIPLGAHVRSATAEVYSTKVRRENGVRCLVFSREAGFSGRVELSWSYLVRNTVVDTAAGQKFSVPLLAAQPTDIAKLSYTIQMPEEFTGTPVFSSGYYADGIDNYMDISVKDGVINAEVKQKMMVGDALMLSLETPPSYFSMRYAAGRTVLTDRIVLLLCWPLALLLWFFKMRYPLPTLRMQPHPPAAANAGVMRCVLAADAPDLALMVVSWAVNGYLTITQRDDETVCLHQRMPMGNECEIYETKVFQALFYKREHLTAPGRQYTSVSDYAKKPVLHFWMQRLFRREAIHPMFLRGIGLLAGSAASLAVADTIVDSCPVRLLAVIPLTVFGGILHWILQDGLLCLLHRSARRQRLLALGSAIILLVGAALAGCAGTMVAALALQIFIGLVLLFGVQRSQNGVAMLEQCLALYRYLRALRPKNVEKLQGQASEYYYKMLPYAEALFLGRRFSAAFSGIQLEPCGWYDTQLQSTESSLQFYASFHQCMQQLRTTTKSKKRKKLRRKHTRRSSGSKL